MPDDISILYGRVNKLDTRMAEIEATRPFLKEMIERNVASNEKLGATLQEIQLTMVKMNEKIDEQNTALTAMKQEFEEANKKTNEKIEKVDRKTSERFDGVDLKINEIEDKGKFDIWSYLKSNLPWIIIGLGLIGAIVADYIKV